MALVMVIQLGSPKSFSARADFIEDLTVPVVADASITVSGISDTSVTLSWTAAEDDDAELSYQVVGAAANNIDTAENAQANGTVLQDWTPALNTVTLTDLTPCSTYYYNVLVKDTSGNMTAYTMQAQNTLRGAVAEFGGNGGTELFLGGNYIELGISNWGDLGTEGSKPAGIRGTDGGEYGGGVSRVGMSADFDGYNNGHDMPIDYYLPGSPEERFSVGYKIGDTVLTNSNSAVMNSKNMITTVQDLSDIAAGSLKAKIVSTWTTEETDVMEITQIISFGVDDKFYNNTVTIKNLSGADWDGARYMRSFDPDNTVFRGGGYTTNNTVTNTIAEDGKAVVVAESLGGDNIFNIFGSLAPIFFYSKDAAAVASTFGFSNSNPYAAAAYDSPTAKGATIRADQAISIAWDSGALPAGGSKTFSYYTSLDERDFSVVEQEIEEAIVEQEDTGESEEDDGDAEDDADSSGCPAPAVNLSTGLVEGKSVVLGTLVKTGSADSTNASFKLIPSYLEAQLNKPGDNPVISISYSGDAGAFIGRLTGIMIEDMGRRGAVFEMRTDSAIYQISADELDMEKIAGQFGENIDLSDIQVNISISQPTPEQLDMVAGTLAEYACEVVIPAVEFSVTCRCGDRSVEVTHFDAYVQRMVALGDDVDPSRITTGIVVDPDGTVRHVPTTVTQIDGVYYALIHSLTNSLYSVIWHPYRFADMDLHWAGEAVNDMGARLVAEAGEEDDFLPEGRMSRAEFVKWTVKALGLKPGEGEVSYSDVQKDGIYAPYISTAAQYGLVQGYEDGTFRPDEFITRQQALVVLAQAIRIAQDRSLSTGEEKTDKILPDFSDNTAVSPYARQSVTDCLQFGILTGESETVLAPGRYLTRAEAAVLLHRLLEKADLI